MGKRIEKGQSIKEFSKMLPNINLPQTTYDILLNIDDLIVEKDFVRIVGWACIEDENSQESHIYTILKSQNETVVFDSILQKRPDVSSFFKKPHYDYSGLITTIRKNLLKKGWFQLGIYIKNKKIESVQFLDKYIQIE